MFRKTQCPAPGTQFSILVKVLIIAGLVLSTFCLTAAGQGISKTITYSMSTGSPIAIPGGFSITIAISHSASGTITITGPGGFSASRSVSSLGSSSFDVTLGAAGTYTVNESYNLTVIGSNFLLGDIPMTDSASATPWTFTTSTPGATANFQVSSSLGSLTVTNHSANISASVSGMSVTITIGAAGLAAGDSVSATAQGTWTVSTSVSVTAATGTVAVNTNNAAATFDLTGVAARSGGGTSQTWTDMPAGSYTCTFNPIAGFTTPAPETQTLAADGTITFTGTYTPIPGIGTIVVTTNNAAATFDLTGAAPRSGSGTSQTWTDMPTGSYTCTFNPIAGFNTPSPQTKNLIDGDTTTFNGEYTPIPQTGTVVVNTNNAAATFDLTGASSVSGSGLSQTWTDMPPGAYTCTFNPIIGFNTPAPDTQTLAVGGTITFNGVYAAISQTGTVVVTTSNVSATFDVVGPADRSGSGTSQTWAGMPEGMYTCTFNPIAGFNTPAPQTQTLGIGGTITFDGVYTAIPQTGTVVVTTNNAAATFDLTGAATRSGSGTSETWTDMPPGSYTVTFNPITGFNTPAPQTQTLTGGDTITFDGEYTLIPGTGTVVVRTNLKKEVTFTVTSPDYTEADFSFEDFDTHRLWTLPGVSTGDHTATYGDVPGYTTPAPETLTLVKDGTIEFVGEYVQIPLPPWDVNKDGVVDVVDIGIISSNIGKPVTPELDLNSDGVINILDLLIVTIHYGEKYGIEEEILSAAPFAPYTVPDYLFQNYPNPSNPGTWIPFMMAEGNEVAVSIYSPSGQLVRRLDLGYRDPGIYVSKDRGAYWDGSNEYGEQVASGVYFYHIQAGRFSAVRKMLISR